MPRLERLARRASLLAVLGVVGASFPAPFAGPTANRPASIAPTIGSVAAQLGVKVMDRTDEEFALGVQFTGALEDTLKLATFGMKGFRVGARVTAARIAQDRVHIEADDVDPPRREWVRVRIDANGTLVPPPRT